MPNWSNNYMKITGPSDELARFKQTYLLACEDGLTLDFNAIVPVPDIFNDEPVQLMFPDSAAPKDRERVEKQKAFEAKALKATGSAHARDWIEKHWGTNTLPYDFNVIRDEPNNYECVFATGWCPPVGILQKLSEMFPALDFFVNGYDSLTDFAFRGTIKDGNDTIKVLDEPIWQTVDPKTGEIVSGTMEELGTVLPERDPGFFTPAWDRIT